MLYVFPLRISSTYSLAKINNCYIYIQCNLNPFNIEYTRLKNVAFLFNVEYTRHVVKNLHLLLK